MTEGDTLEPEAEARIEEAAARFKERCLHGRWSAPYCEECTCIYMVDLLRADRERRPEREALRAAGNLLAVIHRDGGHYIQEHGWKKAGEDAEAEVLRLRSERESAETLAEAAAPVVSALQADPALPPSKTDVETLAERLSAWEGSTRRGQ